MVIVGIGPERGCHQANVPQARRELVGYVGETPPALVSEQITIGGFRILPRHHATTPENIEITVSIEIRHAHHCPARPGWRQRARLKISGSVVKVQPVLVRGRQTFVFTTATDHVQIGITIPIGIEKYRTHRFVFIAARQRFRPKRTVTLLHVNAGQMPKIRTHKKIVQRIAVHVTHGQIGTIL